MVPQPRDIVQSQGYQPGASTCLCERGDRAAVPARRGVHDAVREHVRASGDSNNRGQFPPGERVGGAQPRDAPGPPKKLRRKKIRDHEGANEYLKSECLPDHNRRFAQSSNAASEPPPIEAGGIGSEAFPYRWASPTGPHVDSTRSRRRGACRPCPSSGGTRSGACTAWEFSDKH
jgi:hypothetical protein